MKIKTSELQGAALDWSVAKCEGYPVVNNPEQGDWKQVGWWQCGPNAWQPLNAYSTDWSQGGPIIERLFSDEYGLRLRHDEERKGVWASLRTRTGRWFGPTALIAAMRCYVASKLGDEVDIPEELL